MLTTTGKAHLPCKSARDSDGVFPLVTEQMITRPDAGHVQHYKQAHNGTIPETAYVAMALPASFTTTNFLAAISPTPSLFVLLPLLLGGGDAHHTGDRHQGYAHHCGCYLPLPKPRALAD